MGRTTTRRVLLAGGLASVFTVGCTPATLWHVFGNKKVAAPHPLPAKDGKSEVTVLVLASAPPTVPPEFIGVDREIAVLVGKKLADESRDDKKPFKPVEQGKVDRFVQANPNWRAMSAGQIGKQLGADYVIDLQVTAISLYSATYGREAPAGSATLSAAVYDTANPDAVMKEYGVEITPSAKTMSPQNYRRWFLDRIATEVAWNHIPHAYEQGYQYR